MYNIGVSDTHSTGRLRSVDPAHDLDQIANLIELCFAHQMDDDGRDYLRHIRRAAHDVNYQRWMRGSNEQVSSPLFGFVWEQNEKIVGNLTLIPFNRDGIWRYLAANIATHPSFRGQGIARRLTQHAIQHVRSHKASAIWLQVRDDNPSAQHLYLSLGFEERARRTTWEALDPSAPLLPLTNMRITASKAADWPKVEKWLQHTYPATVAWNFNIKTDRYQPGFLRKLAHFIANERIEQWSIRRGGDLAGMAIWDASQYNAESLWVAPNPDYEQEALSALLTILRREVLTPRPLTINYPAGQAQAAFQRAGFTDHITLVWMEINFENDATNQP